MRYAFKILQLNFLSVLKRQNAIHGIFMFISNITFFAFWILYFAKFRLQMWTLSDVGVIYGLVTGAYGLACLFFGGSRYLARTIYSGGVDVYLTRPKNVFFNMLTARALPAGLGDFLSMCFFLILFTRLSLMGYLMFLAFVILGCCIIVSYAALLGCIAFYAKNSEGLTKQLFEFLLTFSSYPQSIFNDPMRIVLHTVVPSAMIGYMPLKAIMHMSCEIFILVFGIAIFMLSLSIFVFYKGLLRYQG